jgi:peptidyl-prolyl cis-trans isomerase D
MVSSAKRRTRAILTGIILFISLLAIVITGFGTGGFGSIDSLISGGGQATGTTIATVEGQKLSEQKLTDTINRQYSQARQQQPGLTLAGFLGNGIYEQLVNQLIVGMAVQSFGTAQGLTVSQRMVDREIVNIPAFRGVTGQFDETAMRAALASQNVTEAELRQDITQQLMQRQLLGPIALTARVPEGVAREYANLLLERRVGAIGVVPAQLLQASIHPTEAQIQAFYRAHRDRFVVPERRVIQYAVIGRDQIAAQTQATDAEIQAYYNQHSATYGAHETRNLQSVVLPTQAAAQAFAQRVRGGTSFADAARGAGFAASDIAFPNQTPQQFGTTTSPQIAQAVFGAAQGAIVGPIRSPFGFHVVRVDAINRTAARPLESVRAEIASTIARQKANDAFTAIINRIQDRISDGSNLSEIAQAEHLQLVTTPPVTQAGQSPDQPFTAPAELQPLLQPAFEIDAEHPEPVIQPITENERYALLGIERAIAAAPPPLAQIHDRVRDAAAQDMALQRSRQIAQQIADAINRGTPPAQAFAQAQPAMPAPRPIDMRRADLSRAGQQNVPPLVTLFSLPERHARLVPAPNNAGWYVVYHQQRTPGDASHDPEMIAATRAQFSRSASEEIAGQFARAVELQSRISRNAQEIAAVKARLSAGAAE